MFRLSVIILFACLGLTVSLHGQQKPLSKGDVRKNIKSDIKAPDSASVNRIKKDIKQTVESESKAAGATIKDAGKQSLPAVSKPDAKKISQKGEQKLTDKATNLQYNSDNPGDAPWKKKQFSKNDLNDLGLPAAPGKIKTPALNNDKEKDLSGKIKSLQGPSFNVQKFEKTESAEVQSKTIDKGRHRLDSIMKIKDRIEASGVQQELLQAKRVYSEKYIRRLYDSLGIKKGDSLFKVGMALAKTEAPKEELLKKINNPIADKMGAAGVGYDEKAQALKPSGVDKLSGLSDKISQKDLSSLKLPTDALSELEPMKGRLLDSKYMPAIDSMRTVALKAKRYSIDEKQVTDEIKQTSFVRKPSFMDKSYFDLIVSFVNDTTFSIAQISPSWGYHFTNTLSFGVGPQISLQYHEKKLNALVGFRTFVKAEFFNQRAYLQVEDNVGQSKLNNDATYHAKHSILTGGGVLVPVSKKIAINFSVLYRVNQKDVQPGGSPWVIRVGLSSIKNVPQQ